MEGKKRRRNRYNHNNKNAGWAIAITFTIVGVAMIFMGMPSTEEDSGETSISFGYGSGTVKKSTPQRPKKLVIDEKICEAESEFYRHVEWSGVMSRYDSGIKSMRALAKHNAYMRAMKETKPMSKAEIVLWEKAEYLVLLRQENNRCRAFRALYPTK